MEKALGSKLIDFVSVVIKKKGPRGRDTREIFESAKKEKKKKGVEVLRPNFATLLFPAPAVDEVCM